MSGETMLYDQRDEIEGALFDRVRTKEEDKYLVFCSAGVLYGVNADYVVEILTETSITTIPLLPAHISGVINLRGMTIPVVNFRLLLGQEPCDDYCTIVLNIEQTQIGIQVDDVDQMVDIDKEAILPVPSQHSSQRMITGMYTLPTGGTVMVLDGSLLLHE